MPSRIGRQGAAALALLLLSCAATAGRAADQPHNVILFVADGLRSAAVTPQSAPALAAVRDEGVNFQNSHSVYPTVTTVNASALATGHLPGDTGDFGNKLYIGSEPFGFPVNGVVAPMEDEETLGMMNQRFGGNYLGETSLLEAARAKGWSTAAIGKLGPIAIQDVVARGGETIVIDDDTGLKDPGFRGLPLPADIVAEMKAQGIAMPAPDRGLNQWPGAYNLPGVKVANRDQQDWFVAVATKVVLPRFKAAGKPFALVFWSRDPDGTQHNQGDSLNQLTPGINGPTSLAAVRNASDDLQALRDALKALGLDQTTDIVVVADHGFSTTSKQSATSAAAKISYRTVPPGYLPPGFLATDLSKALGLKLWDATGLEVDLALHNADASGNYMLGADAKQPDVVIAANGGSDLIYLPGPNAKALASRIVASLMGEDYTGAFFVDDGLGPVPGALPLSTIRLVGSARAPRPSIIVSFKSWDLGCPNPELCAIEIADTDLQQGQGIHGAFSRADTHNFMAAIGPDFKAGFLDPAPVGNADIAPTLARITGLTLEPRGQLMGRVLEESLKDGQPVPTSTQTIRSEPGPGGFVTVLNIQTAGTTPYFDAAGAPGRTQGLKP
jgi:arylsulfatase A-like enzyme